MGAPAHVIAEARAAIEAMPAKLMPVLPECWHATVVFLRMSDQWRVHIGMAGPWYQGLDLAALPIVLQATEPTIEEHLRRPLAELLDQLHALASGARKVLNG